MKTKFILMASVMGGLVSSQVSTADCPKTLDEAKTKAAETLGIPVDQIGSTLKPAGAKDWCKVDIRRKGSTAKENVDVSGVVAAAQPAAEASSTAPAEITPAEATPAESAVHNDTAAPAHADAVTPATAAEQGQKVLVCKGGKITEQDTAPAGAQAYVIDGVTVYSNQKEDNVRTAYAKYAGKRNASEAVSTPESVASASMPTSVVAPSPAKVVPQAPAMTKADKLSMESLPDADTDSTAGSVDKKDKDKKKDGKKVKATADSSTDVKGKKDKKGKGSEKSQEGKAGAVASADIPAAPPSPAPDQYAPKAGGGKAPSADELTAARGKLKKVDAKKDGKAEETKGASHSDIVVSKDAPAAPPMTPVTSKDGKAKPSKPAGNAKVDPKKEAKGSSAAKSQSKKDAGAKKDSASKPKVTPKPSSGKTDSKSKSKTKTTTDASVGN